jgi:hypothetical protein
MSRFCPEMGRLVRRASDLIPMPSRRRSPRVFERRALSAFLCLFSSGTAYAQNGTGHLGEQSRASIRISVSVAPTFRRDLGPPMRRSPGSLRLSAIDPSFRYSLVTQPLAATPGERTLQGGSSESPSLILIVPD